jgi:glycosyltransferase involved in cell wall biosynthesis
MVSWEFPPHIVGGMGRHVADIAPALAAHGIDLHIVTPLVEDAPAQEQLAEGLTVHRVAAAPHTGKGAEIVAAMQHANTNLQRAGLVLHQQLGGFDLIHGHDWLVAYSSVALKYALKRPLVTTIHSLERGRMQGTLAGEQSLAINGTEWWLTYEANHIITVSRYMAQQLQDTFSVPTSKIDVIYNGVNPPSGPALTSQQRLAIRHQYVHGDEQLICYVGRLVYEKGVRTLIAALPEVRQQIPGVKLVIAGTGPMQDELRQLAHAYGVSNHVIFAGYISDDARDKLLMAADAAVFPSLYEPFGIVALEAMRYNCPVVVSRTGGLAEIVRPHETGIVTEPGHPASLAWGIVHTLQHPKWAAARAQNARRDLQTTYSWQRIAACTLAAYQHILAGKQQRAEDRQPLPSAAHALMQHHTGAALTAQYSLS